LTGHLKVSRAIPISLWIGKDDLLIHQIQRTTLDPDRSQKKPTNFESDPEIKKLLDKWGKAKSPEEKSVIQQQVQILAARFEAKTIKPVVHTETHQNIVVNAQFSKQDFVYPVPTGLQPVEK
jgi:hypothetical protein